MAKLKGLGRGLDALLVNDDERGEALRTIAIDRLRPGKYQPRTKMDKGSLAELASSVKAQGVMQPILVRPINDDRFEIIAGERRWRAAQMAGLKEVPALVREVPDQSALAWSLVENIQREDLNPLEEAQGLNRLIEEFKLTHDAVAQAIGRSRSAVTNLLRLTHLSSHVQERLLAGELDMGHARALLMAPTALQTQLATRVVQQQLSVRETERLVHDAQRRAQSVGKKKKARVDHDLLRLQEELSEALGAHVKLEARKRGAGRLIIHYANLNQLDSILKKLR